MPAPTRTDPEIEAALLRHQMSGSRSPIGTTIRCSCGWSRHIPRQNALARAAKVRGAYSEHERHVVAQVLARRKKS